MKRILALLAIILAAVPGFAQQEGWLGLSIADQKDRGVLVTNVEANSPAEKAGIRSNDIILQFNKQDVAGVLQLTRMVRETPVGRNVEVKVLRDNREQAFQVTTEQAPSGFANFRIKTPDFTVFNDRFVRDFPQFQINTSVNQAGVRVDSLTPQLREFFGVKGNDGVLVASVDTGSDAERAGLKAGDVILAVDAASISNPNDFSREMRTKAGTATLRVVRDKQERELRLQR